MVRACVYIHITYTYVYTHIFAQKFGSSMSMPSPFSDSMVACEKWQLAARARAGFGVRVKVKASSRVLAAVRAGSG